MDTEDEVDKMADAIEAKMEEAIGRPLSEVDWWLTDSTTRYDGASVLDVIAERILPGIDECSTLVNEGIPLGRLTDLSGCRPLGELKSFVSTPKTIPNVFEVMFNYTPGDNCVVVEPKP